ncbi:CLUMA_CG004487, isoform A [Clunio marinus]|uniref:non-specific serine/threonine protein kinase n=1 Tax=Clunio marinus TaxID=568069 RepID=A0A1J1HS02_9DIPT|nr:CLUMA_CG004487, isoform A [Clunio marinus]
MEVSIQSSNSNHSTKSELEKDISDLDVSDKKNGLNGSANINNHSNEKLNTLKKRISSGKTPNRTRETTKAKRVRFFRNGDKFWTGYLVAVSNERYKSFDSLVEDLTKQLGERLNGAIRCIYSLDGRKVEKLDDLEDNKSYVCSCNNENFKKIEYSSASQIKARLSKNGRPLSPMKNGTTNGTASKDITSVVYPRIVTLIRNGVKPRKIMRLLLNKRNSPTFDHILSAITQVVKLDSGCVRKVFKIDGTPVTKLADFFDVNDVFFAYGNERVGNDDFELEPDESKAIKQTQKTLKNGAVRNGPKPKMPVKSHNDTFAVCDDEELLVSGGIRSESLPVDIQNRFALGKIIGDGNFAVVLKLKDKLSSDCEYALKIIDKSKCKGKEHYIDAEVRVMKKLKHQHIISLLMDIDTTTNMYLVLELVHGGDLFDAITRVTRFSEAQSKIMIKHLASALAYLHAMSVVHRDVKPENLLVELDNDGNVIMLKLADFGLACEVTEPLFAVCGTPTYVAPEILMESGYGLKIDVWAAGIILYILLCGFPPFVSPDNQQEPLFDAILSGVFEFPEPYWDGIGEPVRDLINNMLQSDPELRFSSEDILDHYWLMNEEDFDNYL